MQFVQLVASLLFVAGSALAGAVLSGGDSSLNCEANRQGLLTNFLHSEKSRSFAELIATAKWFKPGQLHSWRFLPTYFEKGTGTFSHFFLLNGNFTATEAYEACQRFDGAYLASFHSTDRWEFVNKFIVHGNYWFGLSRWTKCPHWFWPNGNVFNDGAYKTFWGANEPTGYDSGFNCARTVSPASLNCSLTTGCTAKESAWWKTESCTGLTGFSALCETTYPRALYGYLPGKFDWKGANTACKTQFGPGAGLAMPRSQASLNALFYGSNLFHKNWNCWIGLERLYENNIWKHRFFDGNWATTWSYLPRLYGTNYSKWDNEERCVSLYDPTYAKGLGFNEQGYFNYNKCNADFKLDCAICELYWPL